MYYTYILYSKGFDKYYVGQTNSTSQRLEYHNSKRVKSTAPYAPWAMVLFIEKQSRSEAVILERKLKNLSKERLKVFIEKYKASG